VGQGSALFGQRFGQRGNLLVEFSNLFGTGEQVIESGIVLFAGGQHGANGAAVFALEPLHQPHAFFQLLEPLGVRFDFAQAVLQRAPEFLQLRGNALCFGLPLSRFGQHGG
jgi:hypothetical protein